MSDIVERLRARDAYLSLDEADDEIERLRGLLREAADDKLLSVAIELGTTKARLAEAVECCTIKDNRNLWLEIRLQKIMARCADLLDEDQFNELDAMTRTTETVNGDSASAVQPERCCLDYPRCDCNSPPEPAQEPKGCNHFPGQVNCEWCTEVPHE
ncbi:MAG: hypothetical protein QG672_2439 [Pseudomonadota bacterium]|nr:hypothetical protein [Pseudomonadota bacterium]